MESIEAAGEGVPLTRTGSFRDQSQVSSQDFKRIVAEKNALIDELEMWRKKYEMSSGDVEHLNRLEGFNSNAIQDLRNQVAEFRRKLQLKERELNETTARAKVAEEALSVIGKHRAEWISKEQSLQKALASVRAEKLTMQDQIQSSETALETAQKELAAAKNRELALVAMVQSLQGQLQAVWQATKSVESLETKIEMMQRERKDRTVDDADSLTEQLHRQEIEIETLREQINNERISWGKISNKANQLRNIESQDTSKPVIPPRISSAVELVHQVPDGEGTLELEMIKSRVVDSLMNEIKELRQQNMLIISNFIATLDNVTNMGL
ncbi:hypothetical protein HDU97_004080 [Phlyctochytrium planicorne]|nr:hypothetical protein HDU97_004080 [Phlyctochytrium planicorne]